MGEPATVATVNMTVLNVGTWRDAFQFGTAGDTTWSFTSQTIHMDVKASSDDTLALLSLTTANGRIIVDDATQRILHFNVDETTLQAALHPGDYVYDLVMLDGSSPAIRVPLMQGTVTIQQGVTQS